MADHITLDAIISALNDVHKSKYVGAAALVLSIYDWLLLSSIEAETIAKARWTLAKCLYYFIRIITPLGLILSAYHLSDLRGDVPDAFCTYYTHINSLLQLASLFASNWLLLLRLVALYRQKRYLVWFLYGFCVVSYGITLGLMIYSLKAYKESMHYSVELGICVSSTRSATMPGIFYAPFAFEALVFSLTVYRAWQDARLMPNLSSAPFLVVLYRDGCILFFVMVVVRLWNIWIYASRPLTEFYLGVYLMWGIVTVLTTRVYLNLVWLARKPVLAQETYGADFGRPNIDIRMKVHTVTDGETVRTVHMMRDYHVFSSQNISFGSA